jgi:hypothetical protein
MAADIELYGIKHKNSIPCKGDCNTCNFEVSDYPDMCQPKGTRAFLDNSTEDVEHAKKSTKPD